MKILPVNNYYSSVNFGEKRKKTQPENVSANNSKAVDALRKQLMSLAVASMTLVSATSCIVDEPENDSDIFTTQCPKVETTVKNMEGLVPKADYMMKLMGLIPENASILDVAKIETYDETTGNRTIMEATDESDEDKITMDYTLIKPDGTKAHSKYEMYDNGYGYITCVLNKADGIDYSYKRYTQSTTNQKDLAEFTSSNGFYQSAIIKKTNDGIKKILPDNSVEFYSVKAELK